MLWKKLSKKNSTVQKLHPYIFFPWTLDNQKAGRSEAESRQGGPGADSADGKGAKGRNNFVLAQIFVVSQSFRERKKTRQCLNVGENFELTTWQLVDESSQPLHS